jgi:aerobic-type carbon monoxide dehydrogenase small subunit (CoxS/CutS family)
MNLTVNGVTHEVESPLLTPLLDVLREELGITGPKAGCHQGGCGACTVLVDGEPVVSCIQLARQVQHREVTTVEGLARGGELDDLQAAFVRNGAAQCGFCTPGMVVAAEGLLLRNPSAGEPDVREALAGNLCRCTGYNKIVDAVLEVGAARGGGS